MELEWLLAGSYWGGTGMKKRRFSDDLADAIVVKAIREVFLGEATSNSRGGENCLALGRGSKMLTELYRSVSGRAKALDETGQMEKRK